MFNGGSYGSPFHPISTRIFMVILLHTAIAMSYRSDFGIPIRTSLRPIFAWRGPSVSVSLLSCWYKWIQTCELSFYENVVFFIAKYERKNMFLSGRESVDKKWTRSEWCIKWCCAVIDILLNPRIHKSNHWFESHKSPKPINHTGRKVWKSPVVYYNLTIKGPHKKSNTFKRRKL